MFPLFIDRNIYFGSSVSERVATESSNSVIVAKSLSENRGHLICLSGSNESLKTAISDAKLATRCKCPVFLYSVAADTDGINKAQAIIDEARALIEEAGYTVAGENIGVGDPIEKIIEEGFHYSLIVLAGAHKLGFRRFFKSSINYNILEGAKNSVMISR